LPEEDGLRFDQALTWDGILLVFLFAFFTFTFFLVKILVLLVVVEFIFIFFIRYVPVDICQQRFRDKRTKRDGCKVRTARPSNKSFRKTGGDTTSPRLCTAMGQKAI
jgi:hypothetical protein